MNRRAAGVGLILLVVTAAQARAQTYEHLRVELEGRTIGIDGGERANTAMSSGPVTIGKTTHAAFSKMSNACGFLVASRPGPEGFGGWEADITPLRVQDDVVAVRVQWQRMAGTPGGTLALPHTIEVTLRPGESVPLDLVAVPPTLKMPYEKCGVRATMLRATVRHHPHEQDERRLLQPELWLIERLANGTERAHSLQVRGLMNGWIPFYFDTMTEGDSSLEFYGQLRATPSGALFDVDLDVRSRVIESGRSTITLPEGANRFRSRKVESSVRVSSDDVVAVPLPRLAESESGAFADRQYSIRLRVRQIR
jgi:hypothetical protein